MSVACNKVKFFKITIQQLYPYYIFLMRKYQPLVSVVVCYAYMNSFVWIQRIYMAIRKMCSFKKKLCNSSKRNKHCFLARIATMCFLLCAVSPSFFVMLKLIQNVHSTHAPWSQGRRGKKTALREASGRYCPTWCWSDAAFEGKKKMVILYFNRKNNKNRKDK